MFICNYYSIMYHKVARDNNNYKMTNLDGLHRKYDIKNKNNYNTNRYNESSRPVVLTTEHKTYTYTYMATLGHVNKS